MKHWTKRGVIDIIMAMNAQSMHDKCIIN